ncbi:hypothetical protein QJS66_07750 [Kocuria rhizophila]|nr:hypothetical protein QJS66_07750 [Kocuria rhizophila]
MVLLGPVGAREARGDPVFKHAEKQGRGCDRPRAGGVQDLVATDYPGHVHHAGHLRAVYLMTARILSYGIGKPTAGGLAPPPPHVPGAAAALRAAVRGHGPRSGWLADRFGAARPSS